MHVDILDIHAFFLLEMEERKPDYDKDFDVDAKVVFAEKTKIVDRILF